MIQDANSQIQPSVSSASNFPKRNNDDLVDLFVDNPEIEVVIPVQKKKKTKVYGTNDLSQRTEYKNLKSSVEKLLFIIKMETFLDVDESGNILLSGLTQKAERYHSR